MAQPTNEGATAHRSHAVLFPNFVVSLSNFLFFYSYTSYKDFGLHPPPPHIPFRSYPRLSFFFEIPYFF